MNPKYQEQILFTLLTNGAEQKLILNAKFHADKYTIRWCRYIGANFPTDSIFFLQGQSDQSLTFGLDTAHVSQATNMSVQNKCVAIPITAANGITFFDYPLVCISRQGQSAGYGSADGTWTFRVSSDATAAPTFTSLTICLESI